MHFRSGASVTLTLKKGGAITGKVISSKNELIIGASVAALLVRDTSNRLRPARAIYKSAEVQTDDRGVYRLFGLEQGSYLIVVNGRAISPGNRTSAYDGDAPTYYPSATRAEASEVVIHGHEEVSGIDVQYRGEQGWQITGTVSGAVNSVRAPYLRILYPATGVIWAEGYAESNSRFAFVGLPDGDYLLMATQDGNREEESAASPPLPITVSGADVENVEVKLAPFSSITGNLVTSPLPSPRPAGCGQTRALRLSSINLEAYSSWRAPWAGQSSLSNDGSFKLLKLVAGNYHLLVTRLESEATWYLQAITLASAAPAQPPLDVARTGLMLKSGEHFQGVTITLAEGAASVRRQIIADKEGRSLPVYLRVHLVPAEPAQADNVLRFAETFTRDNGQFYLANLAPGRYLIIARPASEAETVEREARPIAYDPEGRAKLRREAESSKIEIELQPCQYIGNYTLKYAAAATQR